MPTVLMEDDVIVQGINVKGKSPTCMELALVEEPNPIMTNAQLVMTSIQ